MDERELRTLHRAIQPILQRTAPVSSQRAVSITPAVLDEIAWNIVLAYVANTCRQAPPAIPRQAQSGEGPLRDKEVRAAVDSLKRAPARPKLEPRAPALARFGVAAHRLLSAYGWAPQCADQAAAELTKALQAVTPG